MINVKKPGCTWVLHTLTLLNSLLSGQARRRRQPCSQQFRTNKLEVVGRAKRTKVPLLFPGLERGSLTWLWPPQPGGMARYSGLGSRLLIQVHQEGFSVLAYLGSHNQ
jgi:hypothetical protein